MRIYLNYNNFHKLGDFAVNPGEIYDEMELVLPEGLKEIEMTDGSKAIEWADGQITLATEICTEYRANVSVPYINDCSGKSARKVYLKTVVK